jgi:hypothetical protein
MAQSYQVFLVVIVVKPTQKQAYDDGTVPRVVAGPLAIIADSAVQATAKAMQSLGFPPPEDIQSYMDRVSVHVLPLAESPK